MGARHVVRKAAFVNINNGLSRLTLRLDPIPEAVPITVVRLGCQRAFFICRPRFAQGPKDGIRGNAKARGTLVPIGLGIMTATMEARPREREARLGLVRRQFRFQPARLFGSPATWIVDRAGLWLPNSAS